jgi:uncharacterized protein
MSTPQLIESVKAANVAAVESLLKGDVEVNQQDEHGWTALNWAAGKGDITMVKLLIGRGADVFKTGRDQRTPYMIALAAGRVEVVKYLMEVEERVGGGRSSKPERKYCKAYHVSSLRQFTGWTESKINWKEKSNDRETEPKADFSDSDIVYIHQDYTVTQSMWHNENVIFNQDTQEWRDYCAEVLKFKVPGDLDLTVAAE